MKKTKKLLACLIAAATMLTMGSTAFAATTVDTTKDHDSVTVEKVYKLTNADTTSPKETFTLEQVGSGEVKDGEATSAPALGTITGAEFAKAAATINGTTGNITVTLPKYDNVGVYEYTLKEVAGTTAGVTYYGKEIKLTVTVVNGADGKLRIAAVHTEAVGEAKSDSFTNTYSAGKLNITKTVTGNLGDKTKKFHFTVSFEKPENKDVKSDITATVAGIDKGILNLDWTSGSCTYEFDLADGETASLGNIPYDVKYTVTESDYTKDGYSIAEKTGDEGTVNAAEQTAAFTNNKNSDNIDTGVNLTTLPYILVFAGVIVIAGAAFITRRRRFED